MEGAPKKRGADFLVKAGLAIAAGYVAGKGIDNTVQGVIAAEAAAEQNKHDKHVEEPADAETVVTPDMHQTHITKDGKVIEWHVPPEEGNSTIG